MLEPLTPQPEQFVVTRLSAVSDEVVSRLSSRGISPESFPEILARLRQQKFVFEAAQLIDKVFQKNSNPKYGALFSRTRFSDGTKAVFYSALEEETSIEEVKYHQLRNGEFTGLAASSAAPPRYFGLFEIDFDGSVFDLFPIQTDYPELTSVDESGYSKCREFAEEARSQSVNAFRTPSARRTEGTCTPVFDRQSLKGEARYKQSGRFANVSGVIEFKIS